MALLDVSELLTDPDFCDPITIISRTQTVSAFGEASLTDTPRDAVGVVEAGNGETLKRLDVGAQLSDVITVYTFEKLVVDKTGGGYSDVIVWQGDRYQVANLMNWSNYGAGYTAADCIIEKASR